MSNKMKLDITHFLSGAILENKDRVKTIINNKEYNHIMMIPICGQNPSFVPRD